MKTKILKLAFTALKNHPMVNYLCMDDDDLRAVLTGKIKEIEKENGNIRDLTHSMLREWHQMAKKDYYYRKNVLMQGHEIVKTLINNINRFQKNKIKVGE